MVPQETPRLSPRDAARICFRHGRRATLVFATTLVLVVVGLIACPRQYVSEARLFVKAGRESVALDPTATTGQTMLVNDSRESEMRSLLDVLDSRMLREHVVDRLGAAIILTSAQPPNEPPISELPHSVLAGQVPETDVPADNVPAGVEPPLGSDATTPVSVATSPADAGGDRASTLMDDARRMLGAVGLADPVDDRERAVQKLRKAIRVENAKRSTVVVISAKADSPRKAQAIVQAFVHAYYELHHQVHRTKGSHNFFESQETLLRSQLSQANEQLRDLKNDVGLVSVEGQREIIEEQIKGLQRELVETESSLSSSELRIAALRRAHPELDTMMPADAASSLSTNAIDDMRDQLYTLQIREREMQALYRDAHPQLAAIRAQVTASQMLLDEQELRIEQSAAASLQARVEKLREKMERAGEQLQELNENEVAIREQETQVDLLRANYTSYAKNRELARISEGLDAEHISNVNVVQPAALIRKPVVPQKLPIALLGLTAALLGAVATVAFSEYLDPSLKSVAQVENELEMPVLLSVPHMRGRDVLLN